MIRQRFAALLAAVALTGCALMPKTPQQGVYEVGAAYAAALKVAVAYEQLPVCGAPLPPNVMAFTSSASVICASPAILARVRAADNAAYATWSAAEQAAEQGQGNASTLLVSANIAVQTFAAITSSLKVH